MPSRRYVMALLALATMLLSTAASDALTRRLPFDQKAFDAAQP